MKKMVSVLAMVAILFVPAVATAQINSNVATVPLQFSISESLSIAVVSGSPQVFPSGGGTANTPLVVSANWNFGQARHLSYTAYFTSTNALVGSATSFDIPTSGFNLGSSGWNGHPGNGGPCNMSAAGLQGLAPGFVLSPSDPGVSDCAPVFDGAEPTGPGSLTETLSLSVSLPPLTPVDSYTGVLNLAASAL